MKKTAIGISIFILFTMLIGVVSYVETGSFYYEDRVSHTELTTLIEDEKDLFVYFYTEECPHCVSATPKVFPSAEKQNIKLIPYNTSEENFEDFNIEKIPTIIYFENGIEKDRVVGDKERKDFDEFFQNNQN